MNDPEEVGYPPSPCLGLDFSAKGDLLAVGDADGAVGVYRAGTTGEAVLQAKVHAGAVTSVSFAPNGKVSDAAHDCVAESTCRQETIDRTPWMGFDFPNFSIFDFHVGTLILGLVGCFVFS